MDAMVTNHLAQQQQQQQQQQQPSQQFIAPLPNTKFTTNSINHTINNQNINLSKQGGSGMVSGSSSADTGQVITVTRVNDVVREIDPTVQLDEEVEETLLTITDDFVENIINGACQMAKHRHVSTVEVKDVQLFLERSFNMWIPGFGTDELRPYKRASLTEAHKQRLALIRRTIKK